jgi:hypothetical protein
MTYILRRMFTCDVGALNKITHFYHYQVKSLCVVYVVYSVCVRLCVIVCVSARVCTCVYICACG